MKFIKIICITLCIILYFFETSGQHLVKSNSLLQDILEETDEEKKWNSLYNYAHKLKYTDLRQSTYLFKYSFDLAEKNNWLDQMYKSAFNLAANFSLSSNNHYALKYFIKSNEIAEILGDSLNIAFTLHAQGGIYYRQNNYELAESHFLNAINIFTAFNQMKYISGCYNDLGLLYNKTNYDKALKYYTMAFNAEKENGSIEDCGIYLNNIACIHIYRNELPQAKELLDSALTIIKRNNNIPHFFYVYGSYGEYYHKKEQYKLAKKYYMKAIALYHDKNLTVDIQEIYLLLVSLYEQMGDVKTAYSYFKKYTNNKDSIQKINNSRILLNQKFEKTMKQMEYDQNLKLSDQRRTEFTYRILLAFSFLLLFSILVFILYKKRADLKKNELKIENQILKEDLLVKKIENKNKELTSKAMILLERNELIKNVSQKLISCKPKLKKTNLEIIEGIIDDLSSTINEKQWEEFQQNFANLYPSFYKTLLSEFPDLSPSELKMCSFLKLNMTSKEIANMTHMTTSSVEVARSRLRKKLGLSDINTPFFVFLSKF